MFKKLLKGVLVGGALLSLVVPAHADEYYLNMFGASAQHKFWQNLAPDFLTSATGGHCTSADQSSADKKNGITRGNNCAFNGGDDTIYIRYSSKASAYGITAVNSSLSADMAGPAGCQWTGPKDNTCSLVSSEVNLGASDVPFNRFTGQTSGYEDGHLSYHFNPAVGPNPFNPGPFPLDEPAGVWNPVVVPFAFIANNSVCKFRCVAPRPWTGAESRKMDSPSPHFDPSLVPHPGADGDNMTEDEGPVSIAEYDDRVDYNGRGNDTTPDNRDDKAFSHWSWGCDPSMSDAEGHNDQCIGHYKCVDSVCTGGINDGNTCTTASQCPDVLKSETRCEAMPINNINHTMAGQIFSAQVSDWSDFGPYYCPGPIQAMMRHEGSGTHATVKDLLQPYNLIAISSLFANRDYGFSVANQIHFTSSSDLTAAVADFPGAIGYVDANKLVDFKGITDGQSDGTWSNLPGPGTEDWDGPDGYAGAHILMYNGVEPTRQKIKNCEYEFWAAQHIYYDPADFVGVYDTLRSRMETYSKAVSSIDQLDPKFSFYWAAQNEMCCKKTPQVPNKKDRIDR